MLFCRGRYCTSTATFMPLEFVFVVFVVFWLKTHHHEAALKPLDLALKKNRVFFQSECYFYVSIGGNNDNVLHITTARDTWKCRM